MLRTNSNSGDFSYNQVMKTKIILRDYSANEAYLNPFMTIILEFHDYLRDQFTQEEHIVIELFNSITPLNTMSQYLSIDLLNPKLTNWLLT